MNEEEKKDSGIQTLPQDVADAVRQNIERLPERHVLDSLVQYFVAEVNWSVLVTSPSLSMMID